MKEEASMIDKFFDKYMSKFIFKFRLPLIILTCVWLAFALWRAVELQPLSGEEQFLSSSHPIQKILDIMNYKIWN